MDKLREEFEQWFSKKYPLKKPSVRKLKLWEAWRDSRKSIVVDFDEPDSYMTAEGARLAYKANIRSIGLSIKGE